MRLWVPPHAQIDDEDLYISASDDDGDGAGEIASAAFDYSPPWGAPFSDFEKFVSDNPRLVCFVIVSRLSEAACRAAYPSLLRYYVEEKKEESSLSPHKTSVSEAKSDPKSHLKASEIISRLESLGTDTPPLESLTECFELLDSIMYTGDLSEVNKLFVLANPSKLSITSLLFLLRGTAVISAKLESWHSFLEASIKRSNECGHNTEELFQGLR